MPSLKSLRCIRTWAHVAALSLLVAGCGGGGGVEDSDSDTGAFAVRIVSGEGQVVQVFERAPLPLVAAVIDAAGAPLKGVEVLFTPTAGEAQPATALTDSSGHATTSYVLGTEAGVAKIEASTLGATSTRFTITGVPAPPQLFFTVSAASFSGTVGEALSSPFVVAVQDGFGNPIEDLPVAFSVVQGEGTIPAEVLTDEDGEASATFTIGSTTDDIEVEATVTAVGSPVTFTVSVLPGPAADIRLVSGNNQREPVGSTLAQFVVEVVDILGNPVGAGEAVQFVVREATSVDNLSPSNTITDALGRARTRLTLSQTPGRSRVEAIVPFVPGPSVSFVATALPLGTPDTMTATAGDGQTGEVTTTLAQSLDVLVADAANDPVSGVNVAFVVTQGDATIQTPTATTDGTGIASATVTLGTTAGPFEVQGFSSNGLPPVTFVGVATAGLPASVVATSGAAQVSDIGVFLPEPLVMSVADAHGNPVANAAVNFTVASGGVTLLPSTDRTDANGQASKLGVLSVAGLSTVHGAAIGVPQVAEFLLSTPGAPAVVATLGDGQLGLTGIALPQPLVVVATDIGGTPVAGVPVAFTVTAGDGSVSVAATQTDAVGKAQTIFTLGPDAGQHTVSAAVGAIPPVTFTATATAAPPPSLLISAGDRQVGAPGATLPQALSVVVRNAAGAPIEGVSVEFAVTGDVTLSLTAALTDLAGTASTIATIGATGGAATVQAKLPREPFVTPVTFRVNPSTSNAVVMGYVETLRNGMAVSDIDYDSVDYVIHGFLFPDANGGVQQTFNFAQFAGEGIATLTHLAGKKIVASVGGATLSTNFAAVTADPAKRALFVQGLLATVQSLNYDGVDIDWEFPLNATERANHLLLMQELHTAFKAANPEFVVMFGISTGFFLDNYDFEALKDVSDFGLYFGYDWNNPANGPMTHTDTLTTIGGTVIESSVRGALDFILDAGYPADKLIMGIPLYSSGSQTSWFVIRDTALALDPEPDARFLEVFIQGQFWNTPRSIEAKLDAVLEAPSILTSGEVLRGVSFWEFGHEGGTPDLSAAIRAYLDSQ